MFERFSHLNIQKQCYKKKLDHEDFIGIMLKVLNSRPIKCNLSCSHSSLMLNVDGIRQRNKHCYGEINIVTVI